MRVVTDLPAGYAEHVPGADLAGRVACFWTRLGEATGPRPSRVLPDGSVDFVVSCGLPGRSAHEVGEVMAVGTMTRPLLLDGPDPRLYLGVRFRPGHAFAAFGIAASAATDERLPLAALEREAAALEDRLSDLATDGEKLAVFMAWIRRRMLGAPDVPVYVRAAVRRIERAEGNVRVTDLPGELGVTRQQLARQFAVHVGVSPKKLARIMRARAVLARADAARAAYPRIPSWSAIAQDLGYYDQPHLIDEVRELTGLTPGEWLR